MAGWLSYSLFVVREWFAPTIVIFSGIVFYSFPSIYVKTGSALAFLGAAVWTYYALILKREEWILVVPRP